MLYESIDAVFNNHNFWINMHPEMPIKDINFDEMDTSLNWEYVMLDTIQFQTNTLHDDEVIPERARTLEAWSPERADAVVISRVIGYGLDRAITAPHSIQLLLTPSLPVSYFAKQALGNADIGDDIGGLGTLGGLDKGKQDAEQNQLQDIAQILDMPPPWAPKIYIDKEAFLQGTPLGEETIFFNKVKIDNFAPYSQVRLRPLFLR